VDFIVFSGGTSMVSYNKLRKLLVRACLGISC